MTDLWDRRLRRAATLVERWPFAGEVLQFLATVTRFQKDVYQRVAPGDDDRLELAPILPLLPGFLELIAASAPPALAGTAQQLRRHGRDQWIHLLESYWHRREVDTPAVFFARTLLQPVAAAQGAMRGQDAATGLPQATCPRCGRPPLAGILRDDRGASASVRFLVCSFCFHAWSFPRVLCPGCQEERPDKLPRFTAQELPWIRVDACDSCQRYLKSIDQTRDHDAEPVADELGSTPLDVRARELGYRKIEPNLAGL